MNFDFANITAKVIGAAGKLKVRSALNPVLWLCAITAFPAILIAAIYLDPVPMWLQFCIYGPISTAIIGFFYLLFIDRDKLQSEEWQIKDKSLDLIQEKGDKFPRAVYHDLLETIEDVSDDPDIKQLPDNTTEKSQ